LVRRRTQDAKLKDKFRSNNMLDTQDQAPNVQLAVHQ
jgi:hypothetical protein